MRSMALSTWRRMSLSYVRTLSRSTARSAMMLLLVPATLLPTVTTANSPGLVSRATMVCSLITMDAASTTGSTLRCGIEPCEP